MQWHEPKVKPRHDSIKKTVTIMEPDKNTIKQRAAGSLANRHKMYQAMGFGLDELGDPEADVETNTASSPSRPTSIH